MQGCLRVAVVAAFVLSMRLLAFADSPRPEDSNKTADQELDRAKEQETVKAIKTLGGSVTVDETVPVGPVVRVYLIGRDVKDGDQVHLEVLSNLTDLVLGLSNVTDAGLKHLKGLSKLKVQDLSDTGVTDAGLEHLKALANLETLDISGTDVTDAGLSNLAGLTKLRFLDVSETQVTDAGLESLKKIASLQCLYLRKTKVTDTGLKAPRGHAQPPGSRPWRNQGDGCGAGAFHQPAGALPNRR